MPSRTRQTGASDPPQDAPPPRSPGARSPPENHDLDSAADQFEGIGQSGMDFQEAHEGGLGVDRALGNDENRSHQTAPGDGLTDESVNPDTSFSAGYSLDDADKKRDVPVFDRADLIPGNPDDDEREPPAGQAKRS